MSRTWLQIINGLLAILTLALGASSMAFGAKSPIYASAEIPSLPVLDSNLRFFGGMGVGLALALLWILPTIEQRTVIFRVIWLAAFIGGLGRILSFFLVGSPPLPLLVFTVLEVPAVPLLLYWQSQVAKAKRSAVFQPKQPL
ncbi:MAG: DUF4345 domain-containing protein [Planctomycetota bacterium]|nr:MAG: DUF4345 domain-containing protein [Planctomycetota bacterium]